MDKLSWDITTIQVNSALHPSRVAKSSTSFGWDNCGKVTAAGRQVTLCDPVWHLISHSGEVISQTAMSVHLPVKISIESFLFVDLLVGVE